MATYAPGTFSPQNQAYFRALASRAQPAARPRGPRSLDPLQEAQYQLGISNANVGYGQGLAQNAYSRGQAQQGYADQRYALQQGYQQQRQEMPYIANARGILGSGVWKQDVMDADKLQAFKLAMLNRQQAGALGQFDLTRQQLESQRAHTLAGLRSARAAALQQILLGLDGYSGG